MGVFVREGCLLHVQYGTTEVTPSENPLNALA